MLMELLLILGERKRKIGVIELGVRRRSWVGAVENIDQAPIRQSQGIVISLFSDWRVERTFYPHSPLLGHLSDQMPSLASNQ